jgi:hypothetical protein
MMLSLPLVGGFSCQEQHSQQRCNARAAVLQASHREGGLSHVRWKGGRGKLCAPNCPSPACPPACLPAPPRTYHAVCAAALQHYSQGVRTGTLSLSP